MSLRGWWVHRETGVVRFTVDFGMIRLTRQTEYKCIELILDEIVSKMFKYLPILILVYLGDNVGTKV